MIKPFLLAVAVLFGTSAFAQSPKERALSKAQEGIRLVDEGKIADSIKALQEAVALEPDNYAYAYELAYTHYQGKLYPEAIKHLDALRSRKEVTDKAYQLLGNAYDLTGDAKKAVTTYEEGLRKFPVSGCLYLELGNIQLGLKEYDKALTYYEKGIETTPKYPSNYYRAAKLYLASNNELWGLIYGELFMNLERNSARTAEMSKLLYDTYKSEITFSAADSSVSGSFASNVIDVSKLGKGKTLKLPFSIPFESAMAVAAAPEHAINLRSLDKIRTRFVNTYYAMDLPAKYPNILFEYERAIAKAGHAEAYNHWILMKGDENGFDQWMLVNKYQWGEFVTWFKANPLAVDAKRKFYRAQYD